MMKPSEIVAEVARITFKLGPIMGRATARLAPDDAIEITARLRTFERDTSEPWMVSALERVVAHRVESAAHVHHIVRAMFMRLWDYEFKQGLMVDGVRSRAEGDES